MTLANGQGNGGNPFADYAKQWADLLLAEMPQATYYSSPTGQAFSQAPMGGAYSPRRGRYFQQADQDVYSDYLGNVGTSIRAGEEPTTFSQYLETDPWSKRYGQLPQYERGVTRTYSDPRTRFIFY